MGLNLPDFRSDAAVWSQIFGNTPVDLSRIEAVADVLPERCRYKIEMTPPKNTQIVFFRLASSASTSLKLVKALAEIGSLALGDLIPKHSTTGYVRSFDGQEWEYLISEFIDNSMTMEAFWEDIQPDNKKRLIQEIQEAIIRLRKISRDDERVKNILSDITTKTIGGGTYYGQHFFLDVITMLRGIISTQFPNIQPKQVSAVTEPESGDSIIKATNLSEPMIRLSNQDLTSLLERHVHFSHMDMEPRNILLQKDPTAISDNRYNLTAIIDWEMAGFYPDGVEDMLKTTGFGSSSIIWDWYDAYMNFCAIQPPRHPSVVRLMETIRFIRTSTELQFRGISKRLWVAYREKLELEYDAEQMRMVRRAGASTSSEFGVQSFKEWGSECLERIRKR